MPHPSIRSVENMSDTDLVDLLEKVEPVIVPAVAKDLMQEAARRLTKYASVDAALRARRADPQPNDDFRLAPEHG